MPKQNKQQMESELNRLEMEEELSRLESEEAAAQAKQGPSGLEKIETAGRSLAEGISGGLSEPAISGVNAVLGNLIESGFDADSLKDFFSKSIDAARVEKEFSKDVSRRRSLEKQLPSVAAVSEIAGAMAPFSLPGKIARGAGVLVKGLEAIPAVGTIAKGAAEAALAGAGTEAAKQAVQKPTGFIELGEAAQLPEVAETGAKIGAAVGAIPVVGKAAAAAAPRVLSAFGGVSPAAITKYLKRTTALEPLSVDDLKAKTDAIVATVQSALKSQRTQVADDLVTSVQALKDKVVNGAKEGIAILEEEGARFPDKVLKYDDISGVIDMQIARQRVGQVAPSPQREAVVKNLQDLKERWDQIAQATGGKIDMVTGKELIGVLDDMTSWANAAGQFDARMDQALKAVRAAIDKPLKNMSPAYKAKMEEVATDARLLGTVSDMFTNDDKAYRAVRGLVLGNNPSVQSAVQAMENSTGIKVSKGIEALRQGEAVERLSPSTTENFLKSVMGPNGRENKKTLQTLSELGNEDLVTLADRAALTQEFGKLVMNGSRDVNFWKEVLGSGALGGAFAGPTGAMTGAAVGYMVKTYGAPATKAVLDGVIKIKGIPSVQKLNQALSNVPGTVRQDLINGFIRAQVIRQEPDEPQITQIEAAQVPEVYADIKNSNLDAVTKAKALESLSKDGTVETVIVKNFMLGAPKTQQPVKAPMKKSTLEADKPAALRR